MASVLSTAGLLFNSSIPLSSVRSVSGSSASEPSTKRITRFGTVNGIDQSATSGVYAWLGIPYAQPPVGALRWMPPVDPEPWSGVRDTKHFGYSCAQGEGRYSSAPEDEQHDLAMRDGFDKPVGNENCLTLNVWSPAEAQGLLPVILFIHGGSNVSGYSADPIYDGQKLAKKVNAVVVTINYRLGILGWVDLPQLKTGNVLADSGNFALLDQLQALKFVKNNIAAFGGNPDNVTLMEQPTGAVNVRSLLASPLSDGLFHKVVPWSGGLLHSSRTKAQTYSQELMTAIIIADGKATDATSAEAWLASQSSEQVAAYLRGIPADELLKAMIAKPKLGGASEPIAGGNALPVADPGAGRQYGEHDSPGRAWTGQGAGIGGASSHPSMTWWRSRPISGHLTDQALN